MIESRLLKAALMFFLSVVSFRCVQGVQGVLGLRLKTWQARWGLALLMTLAAVLATWGIIYLLGLI